MSYTDECVSETIRRAETKLQYISPNVGCVPSCDGSPHDNRVILPVWCNESAVFHRKRCNKFPLALSLKKLRNLECVHKYSLAPPKEEGVVAPSKEFMED